MSSKLRISGNAGGAQSNWNRTGSFGYHKSAMHASHPGAAPWPPSREGTVTQPQKDWIGSSNMINPRVFLLRIRFLTFFAFVCVVAAAIGCSEKPQSETLTIAYSNDLVGEIRSCGCAADDFGGLGRRATLLDVVQDSTQNLLLVDGGDFFGSQINYGVEKAEITMKSMVLMNYHAVVIGEKELGFGVDFLVDRSAEIGLPIVVSNLRYADSGELLFPPSTTVTLSSGLTIGLIGVMSDRLRFPPQVAPGTLAVSDPLEAVGREIEALGAGVDMIVVLAHGDRRMVLNLTQNIPEIDLVIHGHEGKPMRKVRQFGDAYVLQVTKKGLYMGLAFAVLNPERKIRSLENRNVALSQQYLEHEAIAKLFRSYDMDVAAKEKTDLPPAAFEKRAELKTPFLGSESCQECHPDEYEQWDSTKHAHAFEALTAQSRQYDRDCTPCHVTGYYKRGGYESLQLTPQLINVGCESCHGNGNDHAVDPETPTTVVEAGVCTACHNEQQSPGFVFEESWARIQH